MKERVSKLLGPDGRPVKIKELTGDHAAPTVTGVRSVWRDGQAKGLDPVKLARILKSADEGDNDAFLTLAEEMEERDPHYASVLGQRKRAISLIDPIVTVDPDTSDDVREAVEALVGAPAFAELVDDLLDGVAKGYSVAEIEWTFGKDRWAPAAYHYRDPRFFRFDKETGRELRIKEDGLANGKPIPPYAALVHRPRLKSGLPVRGGLARIVAWAFMLKTFTLQDWAAFLEVFGMPLRVGKYDGDASKDEQRTLLRAVRDLGSDAAAIIPMGMEIEFVEAKGGQGNAVFGAMADYLDKQISKAVIGQTMTTDDGSSLAQAAVHEDVKIDIKKADARQLATTINRDLIIPFTAFNFGAEVAAPVFSLPVEDPEDVKSFSEALANLVPLGFKVAQKDVRKRLGTAEPDKEDDLLTPPMSGGAAPEVTTAKAQPCPHCGEVHLARSRRETEIDALVDAGRADWQADMQPLLDQIIETASAAANFEDFLQRLDRLDPNTDALGRSLAIRAMMARGDGDIGND